MQLTTINESTNNTSMKEKLDEYIDIVFDVGG